MRYLYVLLICSLLLCKPTPTGTSQAVTPQQSNKEKENTVLKKIVQDNQVQIGQQISEIIEQLPKKEGPKVIVKTKIVYIKVYEKPPKKKYSKDYIQVEENKLQVLIDDSITSIPVIKTDVKKPGFFKRLSIRLFKKHKP